MSTTILMNVMEEQELRVAVIRDGRIVRVRPKDLHCFIAVCRSEGP